MDPSPRDSSPLVASLASPSDYDVVELVYRLKPPGDGHVDLTLATPTGTRRLRFLGPRVVQVASELPSVLAGVEVRDVSAESLRGLDLWISIGDGAITFWAKSVTELAEARAARASLDLDPKRKRVAADDVPHESFVVRRGARAPHGALRHFSISMHRH